MTEEKPKQPLRNIFKSRKFILIGLSIGIDFAKCLLLIKLPATP